LESTIQGPVDLSFLIFAGSCTYAFAKNSGIPRIELDFSKRLSSAPSITEALINNQDSIQDFLSLLRDRWSVLQDDGVEPEAETPRDEQPARLQSFKISSMDMDDVE
jgi:hypothetical protein